MKTIKENKDLQRILLYVAITFALSYGFCFLILYPLLGSNTLSGILSGIPAATTQLIATSLVMFFPSLGVLITRLITKEGFRNCYLKPNFKKNLKSYLLSWFGPALLTFLGAGLYFLLFKGSFDPELGFFVSSLESVGTPIDALPISIDTLMLLQALQAIFLAPVLNFVTCFGEEWGWRGYLLPKLSKQLPILPTLLISGVIWGLWHAPLTAIGHNYGLDYPGFPFTGIAMMCLFCIVFGIILSYVTLKTGSCIPAILGHAAINGIGSIGIYLTSNGGTPFIGPAPTGIIGMIPAICLALYLLRHMPKQESPQ